MLGDGLGLGDVRREPRRQRLAALGVAAAGDDRELLLLLRGLLRFLGLVVLALCCCLGIRVCELLFRLLIFFYKSSGYVS